MNPPVHRPRGRLLSALGALALVLTAVAAFSARSTLGMKFPSRVVDAYGFYSIVEHPLWAPLVGSEEPAYDRLLSVNGEPLPDEPPPRTLRRLYELLQDRPLGERVSLRFDRSSKPYTLELPVSQLGAEELLFFFVTYALAGWVVLWSGGLVFTLCARPATRRAYTLWSVSAFLFLLCFYDHHTRAWLFPLFNLGTLGTLLGALWLAYAFPRTPRRGAVPLRWALMAITGVGAVAALALAAVPLTGWDTLPIRHAMDWLMGPCLALLGLSVVLRLRFSSGLDRRDLITAAWGLVTTPVLVALTHVPRMTIHRDVMHLLLPFIVIAFPLSIGYALIRNNILDAQLVLAQRMLGAPFALGALLLSVLGTYLLYVAVPEAWTVLWLLLLLGCALFTLVMLGIRRLQVRLFFPSKLAFRGTVSQLKDQLASQRDLPSIQRAVEQAVARALPTRSARILDPQSSEVLAGLSPEERGQLSRGENVWTGHLPREQHLLVPMRSLGELRAILQVFPRNMTALYTEEDLSLLETLASLGALALHNAAAVQEIESLRRLEVGAARDEKRLALGALSMELCHEMVYPLNFLRDLLRRSAGGQAFDDEDLSFARMEVSRMDRMIDSLRRLDLPAPRLGLIPLREPVERALLLLREPIQEKKLSISVEVPAEVQVNAEADSLLQLVSNLLRNAAQSTPEGGAIGVRYREEAGRPSLDIWDTGPGIPEEVASVLFTRRVTTKADGYGIGLTVVQRIARSFHWDVSFLREADRTCFRLTLPPSTP